jgi:uncharacterized protein YecE (DUF72 family)
MSKSKRSPFIDFPRSSSSRGRKRGQESPIGLAALPDRVREIGERLPQEVLLGASSWSFPGWTGIIYDRPATAAQLAREGLVAYARHPVLRTVGVEHTFQGPLSPAAFAEYAAQVPDGFRFLVKAHEACTLARWPGHPGYGTRRGLPNARFLDAAYARDIVVGPLMKGLGGKAGPLVFHFPRQSQESSGAGPFVERLHAFLSALPRGPLYAVEVRDEALLTEDFAQALEDVGVCPVLTVTESMPSLERQARLTRAAKAPALVVRWMRPPHLDAEEARRRYTPFNRLVTEDVPIRESIAHLCMAALRARRPTFVTLNNKAEGCAPLSAIQLAGNIVSRMEKTGSVE